MSVDPTLVGAALLLAVAVLAMLLIARARDEASRAAIERLAQRLDDAQREQALREHALQERLAVQERLRREDHARLVQTLERRLGEAATASANASARTGTTLVERLEAMKHDSAERFADAHLRTARTLQELRARFEQRQGETQKILHDTLVAGTRALQRGVSESLERGSEETGKRLDLLTRNTDERLKAITAEVEKRLSDGFEKTTATFGDVLKRLALIDEAQRKITELTGSVVSLQEILADKRSRGAFGEVQLNALVANVLPTSAYALQHTLGNGRRADCMLFLPEPTGSIAIDAKFPLEAFQRMTDLEAGALDRRAAERQFRSDVRVHVKAIAERYILPGETSDGAIMFIPAEAVFAEIHAHHPEVVQEAHRARVWMASPTTLVAILNTARAVLKDDATRRQIHVIRRHLAELARDFDRFRERMDRLATHIGQAHRDVAQVHTSARKLSERFDTIEKVEMDGEPAQPLPDAEPAAPAGPAPTGSG